MPAHKQARRARTAWRYRQPPGAWLPYARPKNQMEVSVSGAVKADVSQDTDAKVTPLRVESLGDGRTKLTATRTHGAVQHSGDALMTAH